MWEGRELDVLGIKSCEDFDRIKGEGVLVASIRGCEIARGGGGVIEVALEAGKAHAARVEVGRLQVSRVRPLRDLRLTSVHSLEFVHALGRHERLGGLVSED